MNPYIKREIFRHQGISVKVIEDSIAVEKKLNIKADGRDILSLYCTPLMVEELITGLLLTEGILTRRISGETLKIECGEEINVTLTDRDINKEYIPTLRCLGGFTLKNQLQTKWIPDNFSLSVNSLKSLFNEFHERAELFRLTGCFHSAALSDEKRILVFAEDIGRHNTVDKVIGGAILNNISFERKSLLVSCRISSEIVTKCARWNIPIIASRAAPTDLAVRIAEESGITSIGFVRGDRLNIYTHPQRIVL